MAVRRILSSTHHPHCPNACRLSLLLLILIVVVFFPLCLAGCLPGWIGVCHKSPSKEQDSISSNSESSSTTVRALSATAIETSEHAASESTGSSSGVESSSDTPIVYSVEVINTYPHDPAAFTQGLIFHQDGFFYESTGLYGKSSVRKVVPTTGKVVKLQSMASSWFGEGLTLWENTLVQVAWMTSTGFLYNLTDLAPVGTYKNPMTDGWGLTRSGPNIIGSDGTSTLYTIEPRTFRVLKKVTVTDGGYSVAWLNELEMINGTVWANVWQTHCIALINPSDGRVQGWLYAPELSFKLRQSYPSIDVLNGIAYDPAKDRIFITGKLWPVMYEIKLQVPEQSLLDSVRQSCIPRHSR